MSKCGIRIPIRALAPQPSRCHMASSVSASPSYQPSETKKPIAADHFFIFGGRRQIQIPLRLSRYSAAEPLRCPSLACRYSGSAGSYSMRILPTPALAVISGPPHGRRVNRCFESSLRELTHFLSERPDLADVRLVRAEMSFGTTGQSAQLERIMGHYGFGPAHELVARRRRHAAELSRCAVDGRLGIRLVDEGNIVNTTDASGIVVLTQIRPISLLFNLPQQVLGRINAAFAEGLLPVDAMDSDNQTVLDQSKLTVVNNQVDQTTGTVQLKAEFPNPKLQLWPGEFVNVTQGWRAGWRGAQANH
jgi:hypothetical protein